MPDQLRHNQRWCFYINLPCGAVAAIGALVFLPASEPPSEPDEILHPLWLRIARLDWIGALLCSGMVVCLLLGLQWGGTSKPWNDPAVIGVSCGLLCVGSGININCD